MMCLLQQDQARQEPPFADEPWSVTTCLLPVAGTGGVPLMDIVERYTAHLIGRRSTAPARQVTVVGHHCEAGDVIAESVPLPADIRPGDVIAVPATGAYHHSMASSYNLTGRPPVIAVAGGVARVVVRREEIDDLLRRDVGL
ncbi:hypothetical protein [Nonomuraea cavernae]|uniref:hypothetical protein n=1 Tax=Nonomuraea cavernae TaxID=2045107 RepID=UPI0033F50027